MKLGEGIVRQRERRVPRDRLLEVLFRPCDSVGGPLVQMVATLNVKVVGLEIFRRFPGGAPRGNADLRSDRLCYCALEAENIAQLAIVEDARISVESSDPTFIRFYAALFRPAIPFPER